MTHRLDCMEMQEYIARNIPQWPSQFEYLIVMDDPDHLVSYWSNTVHHPTRPGGHVYDRGEWESVRGGFGLPVPEANHG